MQVPLRERPQQPAKQPVQQQARARVLHRAHCSGSAGSAETDSSPSRISRSMRSLSAISEHELFEFFEFNHRVGSVTSLKSDERFRPRSMPTTRSSMRTPPPRGGVDALLSRHHHARFEHVRKAAEQPEAFGDIQTHAVLPQLVAEPLQHTPPQRLRPAPPHQHRCTARRGRSRPAPRAAPQA